MLLTIETAQFNLSDKERLEFTQLFRYILYKAKGPDVAQRMRGNIILSLDGRGTVKVKTESFEAAVGVNGASNGTVMETNNT